MRLLINVELVVVFSLLLITLIDGCTTTRRRNRRDRIRPTLSCPRTIRQIAELWQTYAWVNWTEPVANDNLDGQLRTRRKGQPPNTRFGSGLTQVGYSAVDFSGNHAVCILDIHVRVIYCDPPEDIENGYFIYHPGMDWRYGGVARYGCYRGYVRNGTGVLRCGYGDGIHGEWSAPTPSCHKITCPVLPAINRGVFECTDDNRYDSKCTYTCDPGYGVAPGVGRVRACSYRGVWLGTEPTCLDTESPVWNSCPTNMIKYTNRGSTNSTPTWIRPTVRDNSGEDIEVQLIEGFEPGSSVPVGTYRITYTASDSSGNSARPCSFIINVRKVRCPRIYPTPYLVASCPNGYDWGDNCTFSCYDNYDLIGLPTASCEATGTPPLPHWSYELNMPTCQGQICSPLAAPGNGSLVCDLWLYGSYCRMFCNDRYDVRRTDARVGSDLFVCSVSNGQWNHQVPDCSVSYDPDLGYQMDVNVDYFTGNCCDSEVQRQLQQRFIDAFDESSHSHACTLYGNECRAENTRVECGMDCDDEALRNGSSEMHDRRKRSAELSRLTLRATLVTPVPEGLDIIGAYRAASARLNSVIDNIRRSECLTSMQIENETIEFASIDHGRPVQICGLGYQPTGNGECVGCPPGSYYDVTYDECLPCPRGTYPSETSALSCFSCPEGQTTARVGAQSAMECEDACPLGTYSMTGTETCSPCMQGTYADDMGSLECTECPFGTTTESFGTTSLDDCHGYEIVAVPSEESGSYASYNSTMNLPNVLAVAFRVYIDTISNDSRVFEIESNGNIISVLIQRNRSVSISSFRCDYHPNEEIELRSENWNTVYFEIDLLDGSLGILNINNYSITTVAGCSDIHQISIENPTISFGKLDRDASFSGKFTDVNMWNRTLDEEEISVFNSVCLPDLFGDVVSWNDLRDAQMTGATIQAPTDCDVYDDCSLGPCGIHNCIDSVSSYICECNPGFTGLNCETNIDDCVQHSCEDGSTCVDADDNYECVCPDDLRGRYCEFERVHGGWSDWGEWGPCSESCDGGTKYRIRTCTQPEPGPEGNGCEGASTQTRECNTENCPVCGPVVPPDHGRMNCHIEESDYMNCTLECEEGYSFSIEPLPYYLCDANNTFYFWNFQAEDNPHGQLPDCTQIHEAEDLAIEHRLPYSDMRCSQRNLNAHRGTVSNNMESIGCIRDGVCTWNMPVQHCDEETDDLMSFNIYIRINEDLIPPNVTSEDIISVYGPLVDLGIGAATEVYNLVNNGNFSVHIGQDMFDVDGQEVHPFVLCPFDGMTYFDFYCVPCERGSYEEDGLCHRCEYGTYQNMTGQTSCIYCPKGFSTPGRGSRSVSECNVPVPVSADELKSDDEDNMLAIAVAVPIVIVVIVCSIVAGLLLKRHFSKGTKKVRNTNYGVTENLETIRDQPNNLPPRMHTAKFTRPKTAASMKMKHLDQSKSTPSNDRLSYPEPIKTISRKTGEISSSEQTLSSNQVIDPEMKSNGMPPLMLSRPKSSLTHRCSTTSFSSQKSQVSLIQVSEGSDTNSVFEDSRPNSALSVTGLVFDTGDALPFIDN